MDRKGGLVGDRVEVGRVGVIVGVEVIVGEGVRVAVGDSVSVAMDEGDAASEGVCVAVGVSSGDGFGRGIKMKASSRMIARMAGIPNLRNHGGSERIVF